MDVKCVLVGKIKHAQCERNLLQRLFKNFRWFLVFELSFCFLNTILFFYHLHLSLWRCAGQRPRPRLCPTMHSKQSIKPEAPPHWYANQCHVSVCLCEAADKSVCVTYQWRVAECVFCDAVAEVRLQLLLL